MNAKHDIALVPVSGDLNVRTAPALRATLESLMATGCRRVVLHMAEVPFVDSSGMAVILGSIRSMRAHGGLLSLVNVTPGVLHILRVARLVDLVPVRAAGEKRVVQELDSSVLPLWRTTLQVSPDGLESARRRTEELAKSLGFSSDAAFDLTLAVGEALGNAVDHTCGEGILATMSGYRDRMVVEVSDCGEGFDASAVGVSSNGERGRGIRLMELLVDSVSIASRTSGKGTLVRLVKLV